MLRFAKYEGLGNDFLVVDATEAQGRLRDEQVPALCDRHRGVGGDGVLFFDPNALRMRIANADGSKPEMCGNGLRCVVLHLARLRGVSTLDVVVDTDAGPHACRLHGTEGQVGDVEIEMRVPSLVPRDLPIVADAPLVDAPFLIEGATLHATAVSMGNPHIVFFDGDLRVRRELAPRIALDPRFPNGVNVGLASISGGRITLEVFERGVGFTEACGTGACAAAVAAVETGRAPRHVAIPVRVPGGELTITVGAPTDRVRMRGPARFVFEGEVP